jgi:hypothetical protein
VAAKNSTRAKRFFSTENSSHAYGAEERSLLDEAYSILLAYYASNAFP